MLALGLLGVTLVGFAAPTFQALEALDHLRLQYLLTAAVLLVPVLVLRRWGPAAVLAVAVLVNGVLVIPELPRPGSALAADEGAPLTLLSFNMLITNREPDAVVAMVRDSGADIVVLQEVGWLFARNFKDLKATYPHIAHCAYEKECDLAILSKLPWQSIEFITRQGKLLPPAAIARFDGFTLVGLHFANPVSAWRQQREYEQMAAILSGLDQPLVVTGDFNAAPWSILHRTLRRETGLARSARTWGTWPSVLGPVGVPIDHVLTSPGVGVRAVDAKAGPGSDHRAVRAEIHIPRPASTAGVGGG